HRHACHPSHHHSGRHGHRHNGYLRQLQDNLHNFLHSDHHAIPSHHPSHRPSHHDPSRRHRPSRHNLCPSRTYLPDNLPLHPDNLLRGRWHHPSALRSVPSGHPSDR